jgi:Zn-dependent peptidase ImmA (M78 family)
MTLPRGFKTNAERTAAQLRSAIAARDDRPLDLEALATHLGASVVAADTLVPLERLQELERLQAFAFSACTFEIRGRPVVVYNPLRSPDRRASDVAHELAHLVLDHDVSEVQYIADIPFRTCRPDQEEQATAFGGTLLLPRPILLKAARQGLSFTQVATGLGVTIEMARYRWNTTGVERQVAASRRRPAARR